MAKLGTQEDAMDAAREVFGRAFEEGQITAEEHMRLIRLLDDDWREGIRAARRVRAERMAGRR